MLIAPVLLTDASPPPLWLIPVIVSGLAVLLRLALPLVVLVALKLVTALAPIRLWPVALLVVSDPALTLPIVPPTSEIAPALAVRFAALLVDSVTPSPMNTS